MYHKTWIVVANGTLAKFFQATSNEVLKEVDSLQHPQTKAKGTDVLSDKPGRTFDSQGKGRHHVGTLQTLEDQEMEKFAKEINLKLKKLAEAGEINQVFLIAGPRFLGILNKNLNANITELIGGKVDKDLTSEGTEAIRKHLPLCL